MKKQLDQDHISPIELQEVHYLPVTILVILTRSVSGYILNLPLGFHFHSDSNLINNG